MEILDDHVELIVIDSDDENEGNADSSDGSLHSGSLFESAGLYFGTFLV